MFKENRAQQGSIFDRCANMTERERRVLENSWAGDFERNIFPFINEGRFEVLYSNVTGRPNTPVNVVVGALIIKEMFGYTDEEMVEHVLLDQQVQHALRLTSAPEIPFSDRTLSRFREALLKYEAETGRDLLKEEVLALSLRAKDILGVNDRVRRMDSMMIPSRCKKIGRLELVYTCVENLVGVYVELCGASALPEQLVKYTNSSNKNATIYRAKPDEASQRLESAVADALALQALCGDRFAGYPAYDLLSRMLGDQTADGKLIDGKDVKPTSLQNPSDPDATFRRKAGKGHTGYVANVTESFGGGIGIITGYDLKQNCHSDQEFGKEVIGLTEASSEGGILISDGAYGSEENFDAAEDKNINFVPTCLVGSKPNETLVDFGIEGDSITRCPCGYIPIFASYDQGDRILRATFDASPCAECALLGICPAKIRADGFSIVSFTDMAYNRSLFARELGSEEYKDFARMRNGVEGVPSVMRRKYGVDSMPVFGIKKSRLFFGLKVAAANVSVVINNLRKKRKEKRSLTGGVCLA